MAYVYMIEDNRGTGYSLIKIGYTTDMNKRIHAYNTHNPMARCMSYVEVYSTTDRIVESLLWADLVQLGGVIVPTLAGNDSEWIQVSHNSPLYSGLLMHGINALPHGRNRKNLGAYRLATRGRGRPKKNA